MMTREFVYGLLVGVVVGGIAGLLMAPSRGDDTRRRISDTTMRTRERVGSLARAATSRVRLHAEAIRPAM